MNDDLLNLVEEAKKGSPSAVEALVVSIQSRIYQIALRYFWNPQLAEEAAQEAVIRIVTKLDTFRQESRFSTWAYRVAVNHFLNLAEERAAVPEVTFDQFEESLELGLKASGQEPVQPEQLLLVFEVKAGCSLGMLQCLDRPHRITYVLGEILEFSSEEGAFVLAVTESDFRQKLHRARESISAFMNKNCGLVSKAARCRCAKQVGPASRVGRIDPKNLLFSDFAKPAEIEGQISDLITEVQVFNLTRDRNTPLQLAKKVRHLLKAKH